MRSLRGSAIGRRVAVMWSVPAEPAIHLRSAVIDDMQDAIPVGDM